MARRRRRRHDSRWKVSLPPSKPSIKTLLTLHPTTNPSNSDTVSASLTSIFHHLAQSPQYQHLIRAELSSLPSISNIQALRDLPILQSVITETLRLHPPTPTGGLRLSGPQGFMIAGRYIPPYTTVSAPRYTIARREYPHWSPP